MSLTAAQVRLLADKGLSAHDIADVMEARGGKDDIAIERRRAADRERKARKRAKEAEVRADTEGELPQEVRADKSDEKEKKNQKEKENPPLPSPPKGGSVSAPAGGLPTKRGCRIPDDFQPDETTVAAGLEAGHTREHIFGRGLAELFDYWRGVPGAKGCKLDWQGTYRNRLRQTAPRAPPASRHANYHDCLKEEAALVARLRSEKNVRERNTQSALPFRH